MKKRGGVIEEIIKILLLDGRCSMPGATWFVAILFEINILCYLIEWGAYKVSGKKYQYSFAFRSIAAIVLLCNGYLLMRFRVNYMQIGTLCSAYAIFHLGNIMKVIESRNANILNNHRRLFGVLSVGVLVCLLAYNTQEIRLINNQIINPYYYLTAACSGWFMIRALAFILIDNCMLISRIFVYIGKKSMYILCCHLLSFKIVAVLQCMVNKDFSGIANHPVAFAGRMWWILYTVAGITVPIMGAIIVDKIREFS